MEPDYSDYLPLSPAAMHVLLALTNGDLHGYGILLEVARQSQRAYKIGPGTLYDNLKKLLAQGLLEESRRPQRKGEDARREYHLTSLGSAVLRAETERLGEVLREARRRLRLMEGAQA
jgi:DNA-binding PadR family transcriptional regulator